MLGGGESENETIACDRRLGGAWLGRRGEPGNEANVPHILIHDSKAVDLELNLLIIPTTKL